MNTIPNELKSLPQWGVWKPVKGDKVPFQAKNTGLRAKSNDPKTWSSFEDAWAVVQEQPCFQLCFFFSESDPYVGLDLDGCRDPRSGTLDDWADDIVGTLSGNYCEVSPSGTGVKLFLRGNKPLERCKYAPQVPQTNDKSPGIEIYDKGRFFAVTGIPVGNPPECLPEISGEQGMLLKAAIEKLAPSNLPVRSDKRLDGFDRRLTGDKLIDQLRVYARKVANVQEGHRNNAAFSLAGHLFSFVVDGHSPSETDVREVVLEWNQSNSPPLTELDISKVVKSAMINGTPREPKIFSTDRDRDNISEDIPLNEQLTDNHNSREFAELHKEKLLFVRENRKWLYWTGKYWCDDHGTTAQELAKKYAKAKWEKMRDLPFKVYETPDLNKIRNHNRYSNSQRGITATLSLAASELSCSSEEFNTDRGILVVQNGQLDLSSGELLPHNPRSKSSQICQCDYDPNADTIEFENAVRSGIGNPDSSDEEINEIYDYVWRLMGATIAGRGDAQVCPFLLGDGGNGKSTFVDSIIPILQDYALVATDALLDAKCNEHSTNMADLADKRFVVIPELRKDMDLNEGRLKRFSGDRQIRARKMFKENQNYRLNCVLWFPTNHLPRLTVSDHAIARRIKVIPWNRQFKRIEGYDRLLMRNPKAILKWIVDGCLKYKEHGLTEPKAVKEASDKFIYGTDFVLAFCEDFLSTSNGEVVSVNELHSLYQEHFGSMVKSKFKRSIERFYRSERSNCKPHRGEYVLQDCRLK